MNEARKQVFSCIDYCGDILGNRKEYSPQFSPNNIRTVIVSPEGIMLRLYKPVSGNLPKGVQHLSALLLYTKVKTVALYTNRGTTDFDVTKEKSILSMLVDPLVCGCIEEIVVLTEPSVLTFKPFVDKYCAWEFNFNLMVENSGGSLLERLASRFPRLHILSKVRMSFDDFLHSAMTGVSVLAKTVDFTSLLGNRVENVIRLNETTWRDGRKLQPATYELDKVLESYLNKVSGDIRDSGSDISRQKQGVFDCLRLYSNILDELNGFNERISKTNCTPLFQNVALPNVQSVQFKELPDIPDNLRSSLTFVPTVEDVNLALAYNYNLLFEQFRTLNNTLVDSILRIIYNALVDMPATAMQSLSGICGGFSVGGKLIVPAGSLSLLRSIQGIYPDFTFSVDDLNPKYDLGVSIAGCLSFLADFAYIRSSNNDSFSLEAIVRRLESGVFDGALRKCFEKMEIKG